MAVVISASSIWFVLRVCVRERDGEEENVDVHEKHLDIPSSSKVLTYKLL